MFNRNRFPRLLREGDPDPAEKGAGDGGSQGDKGDPKPADKGVLYEVAAPDGDGMVKLTMPEIQERLTQTRAIEQRAKDKEAGGDRKLREAADIRKGAQRSQTILDDLQAANKGDAAAARRLATYDEVELTAEQAEEYIKKMGKQEGQVPEDPPETEEERQAQAQRAKQYQDIVTDYNKRGWDQVHGALDAVLDSDPTIGHIMNSADSRIAGVVRRAREEARSALQRRIGKAERENGKFLPSPQNLQAIAQQEVRNFFLDLGYLEAEAGSTGKPAGQPGSGRPVPSLGAGPPAGLPTSFQRRGESPERPEGGYTNEGGMAGHILAKHHHNMETGGGDNFDNQE